MPARSQRTFVPLTSRSFAMCGGFVRESTTLTVRVPAVLSRSTAIPSTTGVPSTSASRHATIGGGIGARWIQAGGGAATSTQRS